MKKVFHLPQLLRERNDNTSSPFGMLVDLLCTLNLQSQGLGFFTAPSSLRARFKNQECKIKCFYPCLNNNKTEVCLHVLSDISVHKSTSEHEERHLPGAHAVSHSDPTDGVWGEESHEALWVRGHSQEPESQDLESISICLENAFQKLITQVFT